LENEKENGGFEPKITSEKKEYLKLTWGWTKCHTCNRWGSGREQKGVTEINCRYKKGKGESDCSAMVKTLGSRGGCGGIRGEELTIHMKNNGGRCEVNYRDSKKSCVGEQGKQV